MSARTCFTGRFLVLLGMLLTPTLAFSQVVGEPACPAPTPSMPTATPDLRVLCQIDPRIQFQILTKFVPEGVMRETDTKTLELPADATDIQISIRGYSVDDHSISLNVNGASTLSITEPSSVASYNRILPAPILISSMRAGGNTMTASAGENPKYNRGGGHIGAGFCFQGSYRARVCNSVIGVEQPDPVRGGCGQP